MATKTEIHNKLGALISEGNKEYLQIMGVDLKKLHELEKKQNSEFQTLEKSLRKHYKNSGKEVAERHIRSFARSQKIDARKIEYAIKSNHQLPQLDISRYLCHCLYPNEAEFRDTNEDITLYQDITTNQNSGNLAQGSVNFSASENSAQLLASADSPYTGEIADAKVKAGFKFSFTPDDDGTYCIQPIVQLNGYWMEWSGVHPNCENLQNFTSLPVFGSDIKINLRVEQLSDLVLSKTHNVNIPQSYGIYSGAIGYDSNFWHELNVEVDLLGRDQTIVYVECEIHVFANNGIHSRIDMQTSPNFYFKVPMVKWGSPCPSMTLALPRIKFP